MRSGTSFGLGVYANDKPGGVVIWRSFSTTAHSSFKFEMHQNKTFSLQNVPIVTGPIGKRVQLQATMMLVILLPGHSTQSVRSWIRTILVCWPLANELHQIAQELQLLHVAFFQQCFAQDGQEM